MLNSTDLGLWIDDCIDDLDDLNHKRKEDDVLREILQAVTYAREQKKGHFVSKKCHTVDLILTGHTGNPLIIIDLIRLSSFRIGDIRTVANIEQLKDILRERDDRTVMIWDAGLEVVPDTTERMVETLEQTGCDAVSGLYCSERGDLSNYMWPNREDPFDANGHLMRHHIGRVLRVPVGLIIIRGSARKRIAFLMESIDEKGSIGPLHGVTSSIDCIVDTGVIATNVIMQKRRPNVNVYAGIAGVNACLHIQEIEQHGNANDEAEEAEQGESQRAE